MQNVLVDDRRIWVDLCVLLLFSFISHTHASKSSQSVARLNNTWSNEPKMGPRMTRGGKGKSGGFGGREDLEPTRRYREGSEEQRHSYGLVFDVPSDERSRHRHSRSPRRAKSRERRRSRSPRHRDGKPYERERRRSRDRDRPSRDRYDRR